MCLSVSECVKLSPPHRTLTIKVTMPLLASNQRKIIIILVLTICCVPFQQLGAKSNSNNLVRAQQATVPKVLVKQQANERQQTRLRRSQPGPVDPRGLPSALPKHQRNSTQHQTAPSSRSMMRVDEKLSKRLANGHELQRKRFKTSGRFSSTSSESLEINRNSDLLRKNNTLIEGVHQNHHHHSRATTTTNSASNQHDLNNNSIDSDSPPRRQQGWRQDVSSINGTVDLSQYNQAGVDRLYGDALLVYFKNFNETLPARRETLNINGTAQDKIPIYRSVSSSNR